MNQDIEKAKIFFHKFDLKIFNQEEGWNSPYAQKYLHLTHPLKGKSIDALDECIDEFIFVGEIQIDSPYKVFSKLQNAFKSHELNNRSMMVGDIIIFKNKGYMVEGIGFSELNNEQIKKMLEKIQ